MSKNTALIEISVIIPLHNETDNIEPLFARLISVLDRLNTSYEIICIDDGSKDNTLNKLIEISQQNQ